ncbi:Aste57867_13366 [Aphanomyces stellatus]|uniref:Aste57867_13366 protein n=1 Tax=Aphanomyces stellatus TaxID=120398 RepID=A0A485KYP0_9STRA|nr:hypothetical protein As57867_013316 [Aphanomyces stellatus]VFT90205.1 Aste57867_13366 [Aphanomyces stellatus]
MQKDPRQGAVGLHHPSRPPPPRWSKDRASVPGGRHGLGTIETSPVPPSTETSGVAKLKALLSEIVRLSVARAQDVTLLGGRTTSVDTARVGLECQFREEWRAGREDEIFKQLAMTWRMETASNDVEDMAYLREHLRHAMESIVAAVVGNEAAKGQRVRSLLQQHKLMAFQSKQLHRALKFDTLLRKMEHDASPLDVATHMVQVSRNHFGLLVAGTESPRTNQVPEIEVSDPVECHDEKTDFHALYENVASTQEAAASTAFTRILEAQRWAQVHAANEAKASDHARHVRVRRIQRTLRAFKERVRLAHERQTRREAQEYIAASRLQKRAVRWIRWRRFKRLRMDALRRKCCARRLATWWVTRHRFRKSCRRFRLDNNDDHDRWGLRHADVVKIQSLVRKHLAMRAFEDRWSLHVLRRRRDERTQWAARQSLFRAMSPMVDELLEWRRMLSLEQARAEAAIIAEHKVFLGEWEKYKTELTKQCLKAKLTEEWVPQLDPVSGQTNFLNLKTGVVHYDHPNILSTLSLACQPSKVAFD